MKSREKREHNWRAAQLSLGAHVLLLSLLSLAFASGALIWWGQTGGAVEDELLLSRRPASWVRPLLVFHGCLFPVQCAMFGYLIKAHFRPGWHLKANRATGLAMDAVFVVMMLSGVGLYYMDSGRDIVVWIHRVAGLFLPVFLGIHWWSAHRWVKSL